jgi:hypothetical protein
VLDGTGELNSFFESAVGDLQLVMRDPFSASGIPARAADAQHGAVDRDLNVGGPNSSQVDLYDPAIVRPIYVGRWSPKTSRGPPFARALDDLKVTLTGFAGHKRQLH